MLGLRWIHKVTNEKLEEIMGMKDVVYIIKKLKVNLQDTWPGRRERSGTRKFLIGDHHIYDKSRDRGRPPLRWRDEIIAEMGPHWQRRAQNRKKWKTNVEAYAQKWTKMGRPLGPPHH